MQWSRFHDSDCYQYGRQCQWVMPKLEHALFTAIIAPEALAASHANDGVAASPSSARNTARSVN